MGDLPESKIKKIKILDVSIDNLKFDQTVKIINNFVLVKKPRQIVTINPEFVMAAQEDTEFRNILNNADLAVADGYGLIFASRYFLKTPLYERITGVDLVLVLCELFAKRKYSIFLLGGQNGIAKKTAKILKEKFPGINICGTYEGTPKLEQKKFMDFRSIRMTDIKPGSIDPNLEIIKYIKKARPKVLFVAYGAPKQEKFIARYKQLLNVPVMMGVGGTFDFISGAVKRAPKWMRSIGLEWLWRLFAQPWRFNRISTATIRFPLAVLKSKFFK